MKNTVKVFNNNGKIIPTEVKINKTSVAVRSIDYHADLESVPVFTIDIPSLADIEVNHADIVFRFHPETVVDAIKVIQCELKNDDVFRNAFLASIESALKEAKPYTPEHDLAIAILNRVAGIDSENDKMNCSPCESATTNSDTRRLLDHDDF